jgi:hypothetical protein
MEIDMSLLLQILNEIEYDVVRKKIGNVNITFDVQATIHSDQQTKRFTITFLHGPSSIIMYM